MLNKNSGGVFKFFVLKIFWAGPLYILLEDQGQIDFFDKKTIAILIFFGPEEIGFDFLF